VATKNAVAVRHAGGDPTNREGLTRRMKARRLLDTWPSIGRPSWPDTLSRTKPPQYPCCRTPRLAQQRTPHSHSVE